MTCFMVVYYRISGTFNVAGGGGASYSRGGGGRLKGYGRGVGMRVKGLGF